MRTLVGMSMLAVGLIAGCASPAVAPSSAPPEVAPASAPPAAASTTHQTPARCHAASLSVRLGERSGGAGQGVVPLIYTNTSRQACELRGVPGVDLHGPADPNGPVYSLPRQDRGGHVRLEPGASASARLVVLSDEPGSVGSSGSTNWVPTELVTIPPGDTNPLRAPWPAGLTVQRQDAATHPGSWVESFAAGG